VHRLCTCWCQALQGTCSSARGRRPCHAPTPQGQHLHSLGHGKGRSSPGQSKGGSMSQTWQPCISLVCSSCHDMLLKPLRAALPSACKLKALQCSCTCHRIPSCVSAPLVTPLVLPDPCVT
jgi:hypothetical protein